VIATALLHHCVLRLEAPDSMWKIDGNAYRDVAEDMYRKLMQDSIKSNQTKAKSRQKQQMKEEAVALEVQKNERPAGVASMGRQVHV